MTQGMIKMIYTVGRTEAYEKNFEEQDQPQKLGKGLDLDGHPYEGGSVWKTPEEAQNYLDANGLIDFSVYGVLADWERDTEENATYSYRNLLVTSNLIKLIEDKELDGLIDEFATNGFPLDGDQFRETLRQHFSPVFHKLKTEIKKLEQTTLEQGAKLTKACVEGGYDICAKCGEAVYADEMATVPAYRKKVKKLEEELEESKKWEAICHCGIPARDHDPYHENHSPVENPIPCPYGEQLDELIKATLHFKNKVEKSISYHHEVEQQKVFDTVYKIQKENKQ